MLRIKRVYEPAAPGDGVRVLVDRLWPRGLNKEEAHLDDWLRDLAPSDELRKWFGHDPQRFAEFQKRYERELEDDAARTLLDELARQAARGTVTLVFAAKDAEHNNAVVLARAIERRVRRLAAAAARRKASAPAVKVKAKAKAKAARPPARSPAGARAAPRASTGGRRARTPA